MTSKFTLISWLRWSKAFCRSRHLYSSPHQLPQKPPTVHVVVLPSACGGASSYNFCMKWKTPETEIKRFKRFEPQSLHRSDSMWLIQSYFGPRIIQKPTHLAKFIHKVSLIEAWSNQLMKPIYKSDKFTKAQCSERTAFSWFPVKEGRVSQDRALQPQKVLSENLV